jgi:hypothetical protein
MTDQDPLDVWLKFESPEDEEPTHEANTYKTDTGFVVKWYLDAVGLVTRVEFATLADAHAWYEREGFQDYSS